MKRGMVPQRKWKETTMTKETNTTGRKPDFRLFNVLGEGETAKWTPIGAAWQHRDGNGFTVLCEAFPRDGRMVARILKDDVPAEA